MLKHVFAFTIAALVSSSASLFAQPRTMYHWRSFSEVASALHGSEDGYQIYIEKYGPLVTTEGWPIRVHITFSFWAIGVQGACWIPSDAFTVDQTSGEARLDATVPSEDGCDWLDGATSVRLQVTWRPDGTNHSRRHYTLLGDTNKTSSEQGWEDRWLFTDVEGSISVDGAADSTPIPSDQSGSTSRTWGHGVIPLFLDGLR